MCADDGDDSVKVEFSSEDALKALGLLRWNTIWTSLGAIAGWAAFGFVVVTIIVTK